MLQPSDLPAGWKATPAAPDPSSAADDAAIVAFLACLGGPNTARNTEGDAVAEAQSDDFTLGDANVSSSATSYRSQSAVDPVTAVLHSPKLPSCYEQMAKTVLAAEMPTGAAIKSASIKITPGSAGGPANVVASGTATIKLSAYGQQVPVYVTIAFITGPLTEAEVDTVGIGAPVPASVVNALVASVATRAAKG